MDLNSLADAYFKLAEKSFGSSVSEWEFGGVEIHNCPPHVAYYPETKTVCVSLSEKTLQDDTQLHFQLSHEVCHCLYPSMNIATRKLERVNYLNEGISTFFSVSCLSRIQNIEYLLEDLAKNSTNYFTALSYVNELLSYNNAAIEVIRRIQPHVNRIEKKDFKKSGLDIPVGLIQNLQLSFK